VRTPYSKQRARVAICRGRFVSSILPAASVLLAKDPGSAEVFAVRRSEQLRFFGGFFAFPGGGVHPADEQVPLLQNTFLGSALKLPPRQVAAARELFEETGVLVARRPDMTFPPVLPDLAPLRQEMLAGRLSFGQVLDQLGLGICAGD